MDILNGFVEAVQGIWNTSGIISMDWRNYVMIAIACVLIYLAIGRQFEPLLLLPISFGMLLVNLMPGIMAAPTDTSNGGLFYYLYQGVKLGIYPPLIFLGIGAMTDFGPLIANPKSFLLAPPPSWVSSLPLLVPSCWDLTCSPRVLSVSSAARMVLPLSSLPVS